MIKSFQKTSMKQVVMLHQLNLPVEFFQKSILAVGGSTLLNKVENHIEADLLGRQKTPMSVTMYRANAHFLLVL